MAAKKKPAKEPRKQSIQEKKEENKQNNGKELYWIIGIMSVVIVIILLIPSISRWHNTFSYQSLTFTKEMSGQIQVYHYYYYETNPQGQQFQYNLYLRGDPRNNSVPVSGNIFYPQKGSTIYLSINGTGMTGCPNAQREVATLSSFLIGNFYKVKSGYADQSLAKENNGTYVTCSTNPNSMVIALQYSNETSVSAVNSCYTISVNSCQGLLDAVEKFEVQSILDAKNN